MDQKHCPECGSAVNANAKFCPECGVPLQKSATAGKARGSGAQKAQTGSARDLLIILGVLAVVAVGFFIIKGGSTPPVAPPTSQNMAQNQPSGMPPGDTTNPHAGGSDIPMTMLDSLPKNFETLVQMGNHFMDQQNYAVAAEIYRRALELGPDSLNVRVDYGACLHGMGLPQRAIEEFRRVLAVKPDHPIANFNMGIVYHDLDQHDSTKVYLNKYLKLDPQGPAADAARQFLKELGG